MSKATTMSKRRGMEADDYMDLVRRFPLRPIRTEAQYESAGEVLLELVGRADAGLTAGESDYLDVLGKLVREYDEQHSSILQAWAAGERTPPLEMLKYLMEENSMNTTALGKLVGGTGQASLILHGKRQLSKANIRRLAEHFRVSPALFI